MSYEDAKNRVREAKARLRSAEFRARIDSSYAAYSASVRAKDSLNYAIEDSWRAEREDARRRENEREAKEREEWKGWALSKWNSEKQELNNLPSERLRTIYFSELKENPSG